ncbi:hypothetical protein [Halalkalibacter akibai]|uniref:hypothetical protein n=1 Tax=Halalkalibacter akibai TaxID=1411 RepID=UPI00068A7916|nr:hypothetical protein [Halalkalibacter akibai]
MFDLLIKNVRKLNNPHSVDIGIKDGFITQIGSIKSPSKQLIEGEGRLVLLLTLNLIFISIRL